MRGNKETVVHKAEAPEPRVTEVAAGICAFCRNVTTCTYPRNPKWPVVQCDEFVGEAQFVESDNGRLAPADERPLITFSPDSFQRMQRVV